jgi:molecular chaperone GrpE
MSQEEHETVENSDLENEESEAHEEASSESVQENELDALKAALAQSEDRYQRVHADFENIRKRLEKEKYQALEYSNEKFAKELIPVIDSLSMAIAATKSDMDANELLQKLEEGVELTMKQFLSVLEKHGITPVSEDESFDPNIHHAVQQIDSPDHESGEIVSTFQKGYRYKGRTLRDAMVVIAN